MLIWHAIAIIYCLTIGHASGETLLDLSHEFDNATVYWPTQPTLNMTLIYKGIPPGKNYWYQAEQISAGTHGGTHLDAPCHFYQGRWCVSDIPLDRLVVQAAVVDISHHVGEDPDVHLTVDHLRDWEKENGDIPTRSLLLIHTGWSRFYPDPVRYSGTAERDPSQLKFPSIEPATAQWLVNKRSILGVGIDTMSVDPPNANFDTMTHVILSKANIYNIENVNDPGRLPPRGATVLVMPMKLKGASGAPCRVVAQVSTPVLDGATSIGCCNLLQIALVFMSIYMMNL